jgi:hypothetical protein
MHFKDIVFLGQVCSLRAISLVAVDMLAFSVLTTVSLQGQTRMTTAQLAKLAGPATGTILTIGPSGDTINLGSGFLIDRNGVVVTNWHVLQGAAKAVLRFPTGEQFDWVRFLGGDSLADVVLLKFPGYELPILPISTNIPDPGEKVVVLGSPLGLSETVSEGIVSAVRVLDGRQLIQISAPISPGSSGGPVLDERGRVFAIASSHLRGGQQLNFAVPIRYALALLQDHLPARPLDSVFAISTPQAAAEAPSAPADLANAALDSAKALIDARRPKEAVVLLDLAYSKGDAIVKEKVAILLYTAAAPLLQEPQDLIGAAELLRQAVRAANPAGKVAPAANYLLGLATLFQVPQIDPLAEEQKSCSLAKREQTLLNEAEQTFGLGRSVNPEAVDKNLRIIAKYQPRIRSMLKSYCKGDR